ncbi:MULTISPECIES: type II secretion system protein GspL [Cupriavidus]|jgi:general secretion pathway protein L|nr:type II secretion system protein GspL [Cupriavidus metallidurans]
MTRNQFSRCYARLPARPTQASNATDSPLTISYAVANETGEIVRSGDCLPLELPAAQQAIVLADARDVLLVRLPIPAVDGARLREALPGLLEERLLANAEDSHIAVLKRHENGEATLAAIDRAWLASCLASFDKRRLRVVPAALCVPLGEGTAAAVIEPIMDASAGHQDLRRLTVRTSTDTGFGIAMSADAVPAWLAAHVPDATVHGDDAGWALWAAGADALGNIDMCQFELRHSARRATESGPARWRWPVGLAACAIALAVAGINAHWWWLAHRQSGLHDQMESLVRTAFPRVGPIVDAPKQMQQQLDQLARSRGLPVAGDLDDLTGRFAHALGPIPKDAVTEITYRERTLQARFADTATIDSDALRQRLRETGLTARFESGQWTMRIAS